MQQMGGGMVDHDRLPPIAIDGGSHTVTNRQRARLQHTDMAVKLIGELAGIADHETLTDTDAQRSGIADLPARIGVERRLVKHHDGILTGRDKSEEHTSELQPLMRISYAEFCLKQKK